eukprot:TRINITY_DN67249_c6_g8_i1.p2 TRINITY_DN67249_c6_g8~~TRINITY_DN67249_c6_g8_i1.p2  ORF type:complete len:115 (-),score=10.13 TRINITY_DN67249_c6_g8_i1:55-399(-)
MVGAWEILQATFRQDLVFSISPTAVFSHNSVQRQSAATQPNSSKPQLSQQWSATTQPNSSQPQQDFRAWHEPSQVTNPSSRQSITPASPRPASPLVNWQTMSNLYPTIQEEWPG